MLARAASREREMAIRGALALLDGASYVSYWWKAFLLGAVAGAVG